MIIAKWNNKIIAESPRTIYLENNHYFPEKDVYLEYLKASNHTSTCPWKGLAHYYDIVVDGQTNKNAAFYYPDPSEAAKQIKGYIAFWKGVEVHE